MEVLVTFISLVIAAGSLVIAFVSFQKNSHRETRNDTEHDVEARADIKAEIKVLDTKLEGIDSGIRDLKAENRSFRNELAKVRDEMRKDVRETYEVAKHALELAEASHRRLDRLGAEKDPMQTK